MHTGLLLVLYMHIGLLLMSVLFTGFKHFQAGESECSWQQVLDGTGGDWCRVKAVISAFDGLLAAEEEAKVNGGNFFSNDVVLSLNVYIGFCMLATRP